MTYTELAVVAVVLTIGVDVLVARTYLIRRRAFWISYLIVLFFQLLTNGVLTGFEIVRYNEDAIIGDAVPKFVGDGRIVFAPVEDLLFGFTLVTLTLIGWVWWGRRGVQREPFSGPPRWCDR